MAENDLGIATIKESKSEKKRAPKSHVAGVPLIKPDKSETIEAREDARAQETARALGISEVKRTKKEEQAAEKFKQAEAAFKRGEATEAELNKARAKLTAAAGVAATMGVAWLTKELRKGLQSSRHKRKSRCPKGAKKTAIKYKGRLVGYTCAPTKRHKPKKAMGWY